MKINILGRTGPRSLKGKSISKMNALKHGAYAKSGILPFEDPTERRRLERELTKAAKPTDAFEETMVEQMVQSYWFAERHKLRKSINEEAIFRQLTPATLAELIDIPEVFRKYAPDYLKDPHICFTKKELLLPAQRYKLYLDLRTKVKGINNYQNVFATYKSLFEGLDSFIGNDYNVPLLLPNQTGIELAWQQQPRQLEKVLEEYAASLYYMISFNDLRPRIRVAMSSWFFLQRHEQRENDLKDDLLIREMNRFQNLLSQFMKYRKSKSGAPVQDSLSQAEASQKNETKSEKI